ncbi:MAG: hypothetical protein PVG65_05045 [Candidatus Thorarchaeota archaeon]|jgi:hypothetical protein
MSDEKRHEEQKYFERLNIAVLSIDKIKELIKTDIKNTINAWNNGKEVDKQCFHIVGPAGVGKTQICFQIANELGKETSKNFEIIMVKSPVLSRDDFIIPFPIITDGEQSFKMLYSDFVPKGEDSFGLFVIDEFSRGDHSLQQLLWQVQNEYAVHRYEFPKGWFVISIDNPDDSEYQMDTMEDAAGLRRQLHIYSEVHPGAFLDYAIENDFHKLVIEFIQTHPDYVYDFEAQKVGSVYANPASWEKLSDHLKKFDLNGGIKSNFEQIEILASGLLNVNMTRLFIDFARDKKDINPKDIFYDYEKVRKDIETLIKERDNAKLGQLMVSFCTFMTTSMPEYKENNLKNIENFLLTMPIDTAALFISQIDSFERSSDKFKYMTSIHMTLWKASKKYKEEFYDAVVECGKDR